MKGYFYNPLLKEGFQKSSPDYSGDIGGIRTDIAAIQEDLKKKVPKIFTSIEELEVGEIGEYQGETNEDFTQGYFYKRANDFDIVYSGRTTTKVCYRYIDWLRDDGSLIVRQYYLDDQDIPYEDFYSNFDPNVRAGVFKMRKAVFRSNLLPSFSDTYYYYPFAWIPGIGIDFENPLVFDGKDFFYKGVKMSFVQSSGGASGMVCCSIEEPHIKYIWQPQFPCYFCYMLSSDGLDFGIKSNYSFFDIAKSYQFVTIPLGEKIDLPEYSLFADGSPFLRVDTQPALDPSDFATAAQGSKADTALQAIVHGTDGDYITTTITSKSDNTQTVSASLAIQDLETADNDHRGLLEALATRNYIDTQIYNVSLNFFFYGVQWDDSNPSPDCTRIGNMSLHAELPVQNAIIGGLLQDDLTFTPFADQSDWSGETVDGSLGQLMLQIPKHYFKSEVNGTMHKKLISQYPLAGFIEIPLMYISAQKATVDRTDPATPKLCSVVNGSPAFRGGQNTADWDDTYRSLLGKPATNISLTNFRQYARNRGGGTAWNCHTYQAQRVLYWLFVTEYATLNSQKAFNAAQDANGYAQGGLGPGVTDWDGSAWQAYNNYNPLIPCGYMLEYGNQTAVKNYNVPDSDGNTLHAFSVNSYRGIQSPFGDIWDWTDGILVNVQSNAAGGVSTCYVTDDPAQFSSTDFSQYTELGTTPRADNWIKTIHDDEQGNIICKAQGGSSASYYCDFHWGANLPSSGVALRGVRFGGYAINGSRCGFLFATSHHAPGYVSPNFGSRLCAFPPP